MIGHCWKRSAVRSTGFRFIAGAVAFVAAAGLFVRALLGCGVVSLPIAYVKSADFGTFTYQTSESLSYAVNAGNNVGLILCVGDGQHYVTGATYGGVAGAELLNVNMTFLLFHLYFWPLGTGGGAAKPLTITASSPNMMIAVVGEYQNMMQYVGLNGTPAVDGTASGKATGSASLTAATTVNPGAWGIACASSASGGGNVGAGSGLVLRHAHATHLSFGLLDTAGTLAPGPNTLAITPANGDLIVVGIDPAVL